MTRQRPWAGLKRPVLPLRPADQASHHWVVTFWSGERGYYEVILVSGGQISVEHLDMFYTEATAASEHIDVLRAPLLCHISVGVG